MKEGERLEVKCDRLPDDWKWMKLKYLVTENLQYGANESGIEYSSLLPRYIRITDIDSNGKLKNEEMLSLSEEKSENYLLEEGDILFARSGASVGKTFIYKSKYGRASFAGYLIRAKLDKKIINPQFFFYYTLSSEYDIWKNGIFIQSTIQNIGADKYSDLLVPVPPLTSQLSLITFLDCKCSEIDSVISKTKSSIEEYKKLKQSIITEVVTGNVKIENGKVCGKYDTYKDSGIEWIGEIPSEWKKIKFKYLHYSMNTGEAIDKEYWSSNEYDRVFYTAGLLPIRTTYLEFPEWKLTRDNDLLLSRNGTPYVYLPSEYACYTDHIIRAKIKKDVCKKFLQYALQRSISTIVVNQVSIATWSASLWNEQILPFPPLSEQQQIADYLDQKCSEIDNLITKKEQLVVELESYKKSLIYEVVTGKKECIGNGITHK